ncbi:hypothetical protein NAP1_05890 [Erythrobacter sp. NAP1]|nr:hypothetical protein NAP1_05890 [Erythrobacter sp. NAP1]
MALGVCGAVAAQTTGDPRGFRIKQPEADHRDVTEATPPELTMMRTARCIVDDQVEDVEAYLRTVPGSTQEDTAFAKFERKLNRCMPEMDMSSVGNMQRARGTITMRFEHAALRGALAENVLHQNDVELELGRMARGDDGMYVAEKFHGERSGDPSRVFALGFAGCVMGHNADAIPMLLETEPASAEEKSLIGAMAPSFGQCVVEGQTLRLTAPKLRTQIAEAVYYALHDSENSEAAE